MNIPIEPVLIDKPTALAAARAYAFTIGEDYEGAGRQVIHCFMSMFGADWDLAQVEDVIERANHIAWNPGHMLSHRLAVICDGKRYNFDVGNDLPVVA